MAKNDEFTQDDVHAALFAQLVAMFATSALQHLGKLVNPASGKAEVNLEAAQTTIDMLDMLASKTRGNLAQDEARMLQEALTAVKLNFVETQRLAHQAASAPAKTPPAGTPPTSAPAAAPQPGPDGEIKTSGTPGDDKEPRFHKKY